MRIAFIVNSTSKRLDQFKGEYSTLDHPFLNDSDCFYTEFSGHALDLAYEQAGNWDIIVSVGGDGTLHQVVNGMIKARLNKGTSRPGLAILPYGSANDFARQRNLNPSIKSLLALIEAHCVHEIDIGKIEHEEEEDQFFINIADAGFGAEVVRRLNAFSEFYRPFPSGIKFIWAITKAFFTYKKQPIEIRLDDEVWRGRILTVVIANSSSFGSGLKIAPNADISDGFFQVVILGEVNFVDYLLNLIRVKKGKKIRHRDVHYLKSARVELVGQHQIPVEADGEVAGIVPIKLMCMPNAFRLYCKL